MPAKAVQNVQFLRIQIKFKPQMADHFSKELRSKVMRRIRSTNTGPELAVRKFLSRYGFRYRLYDKKLPGKPDIVLRKYNVIIDIQGCFWHGHACSIGSGKRKPKTNKLYWTPKILKNMQRDKINIRKLRSLGWKVFVLRECRFKVQAELEKLLSPLLKLKED